MRQQGANANYTGNVLEQIVITRLRSSGYTEIKNENYLKMEKYYIPQYKICNGIYGTPLKTDVLIFNEIKYPNKLAIEMKWQQTSGSVDEKYPYVVENIKTMFPCPVIIVIDGGGYKPGALNWLKMQVDDKLIGVFDMTAFVTWANKGGL